MKGYQKLLGLILALVMVVGPIFVISTDVAAIPSRQTAVDWVCAQADAGAGYDVDGIFGNQCSDFATAYINYLIDGNAWSGGYTTYHGYQYFDISYPAGWQKIENYDAFIPQAGDILVFNGAGSNTYGHVAVAIEGCTTTVYNAVGQDGYYNTLGAAYQSGAYFNSGMQFRGAVRPAFGASVAKPTTSTIKISQTSAPLDTPITFTFSSTGATGYTIGIDKGLTRIDTHECYSSTSYTRSFSEPGEYSAYVSAFNSAGYLDSSRVYFTIVSDTVLPTGTWSAPEKGKAFTPSGSITLSVNANDDVQMDRVTFHAFYDGVWHELGSDDHGGNGTYSLIWNYSVTPQDVLFHAHLYDLSNNYKNIGGPTVAMVPKPGAPVLSVSEDNVDTGSVHFSWPTTSNTTCYDLRILQNDVVIKTIYSISANNYSCQLPAGKYTANLCSVNGKYSGWWTKGNTVSFSVAIAPIPAAVSYQTHVQGVGWMDYVSNGEVSGTSGQSKRLEAIRIKLVGLEGGIEYRTHVQDIGWQNWVANNALSGTSGQSKRLEAIQIRLTGEVANNYDVYYRVHAQNVGWMGWAKNGASAGTAGYSYRLEAIEVKLVAKGGAAPGATAKSFIERSATTPTVGTVSYHTHVQDIGWQAYVSNGSPAGTSGQSKRLEGIQIKLENVAGGIEYSTHVQDIGWMNFVANDAMSGTSGQSKRLEAIKIRLTGAAADTYDVYYCVHAQNVGWLDWAKNGESAGTAGFGYRLEAIKIVLIPKGGVAPGSTTRAFVQPLANPFL